MLCVPQFGHWYNSQIVPLVNVKVSDFELQKHHEACSDEYSFPCKSLEAAPRLCDKVLRAKQLYEVKKRRSESHAQSNNV